MGHQEISDGGDVKYTIKADEGFRIREVLVDGESMGSKSEFIFTNVLDNHSITAVFEKVASAYQIIASTDGGGSISPEGIVNVLPGKSQSYEFIPKDGYHLINVIVDGNPKGVLSNYTFSNVNETHSIIAVFYQTKPFYFVASSVNVGGNAVIEFKKTNKILPGDSISFTVTANPGYQIIDVKSNNISLIGDNSNLKRLKKNKNFGVSATFTLSAIHADYLIQVQFEKAEPSYSVNINLQGKGTVDSELTLIVPEGNSKKIRFTPSENFHLSEVMVDGVPLGPVEFISFTNINENHEVTAIFTKTENSYKVSSSVTGKGKISPLGENIISADDSVAFTFIPEDGNQMVDLILDGVSIKNSTDLIPKGGYVLSRINSSRTIDAVFSKVSSVYNITTKVSAGGIASNSGVVSVAAGNNHYIQIDPKNGYHISSVKIDGESIGVVTGYLFSNVNSDHLVEIQFAVDELSYKIVVTNGANGSVSPADIIKVEAGNNQLIKFNPNSGYRVLDVIVNGVSQGPVTSYLFKNVQEDQMVSVSYSEAGKAFSVKAEVVGAGDINPAGFTPVEEGSSLIYSIQAHSNSQLMDVKIDGVSYGAISTYTFTDISSDHKIQVFFKEAAVAGSGSNEEDNRMYNKTPGCQFALYASHVNSIELILLLIVLLLSTRLMRRKKDIA